MAGVKLTGLRSILICFGLVLLFLTSLLAIVRQQPAQAQYLTFTAGNPYSGLYLYRLRADGSSLQQLTDTYSLYPEWVQNGQWLTFISPNPVTNLWEFCRIRPDGSQREKLTAQLNYTYNFAANSQRKNFSWSPDGKSMIVTRRENGIHNLYRIDVASGDWEQLTRNNDNQQPLWSADGQWIVFFSTGYSLTRNVVTPTGSGIYRIRPDGNDLQLLSTNVLFSERFVFAPDMQSLLIPTYGYGDASYGWHIEQINLADGSSIPLVPISILPGELVFPTNFQAVWSPDSHWVAFLSETHNKVFRVPADHEAADYQLQAIGTVTGNNNLLDWSSDGQWLAFTSGGRLYRVRPDGTDSQVIHHIPSGHEFASLNWSPTIESPYRSTTLWLISGFALLTGFWLRRLSIS